MASRSSTSANEILSVLAVTLVGLAIAIVFFLAAAWLAMVAAGVFASSAICALVGVAIAAAIFVVSTLYFDWEVPHLTTMCVAMSIGTLALLLDTPLNWWLQGLGVIVCVTVSVWAWVDQVR